MRLQHYKPPGKVLTNLESNCYASSLAGFRDLRYFSMGRQGKPYIDMAYALGGFWQSPQTKQVYCCILDGKLGCVLVGCTPEGKASVFHSERLPSCFQLAGGEEGTGRLLLRRGLIDRGWFRERDYILVDPCSLPGSSIEADRIGHHFLLPPYMPAPSLPEVGQVRRGTTAGEFHLGVASPFIARMALSEGEVPELSLWTKEGDLLYRLTPSLYSVENWAWLPHRGKPLVVASTGVYAEVPSIVAWHASQGGWKVVKRFPGYILVRIIRVNIRGLVIYEVWKDNKVQQRASVQVF